MTAEEIAQQEALRKITEGQGAAAKAAQRLLDALEDLEDPIKRQAKANASVGQSFLSLDKAIKSGRKSWVDAIDSISDLREAIDELEEGADKTAKKRQLAEVTEQAKRAQINKAISDSAETLVKGLYTTGVGVAKSLISSYQSGASAAQTVGDIAMVGMDQTANTAKNLAGVSGAAAAGLAALGVISGGTAVAIGAIGSVIAGLFAQSADLAKAGAAAVIKEIDATAKAYNDASKAGAMFANGLDGVRRDSVQAGLTMVQFSKIITENSQGLAQFGGTVSRGVQAFKEVNKQIYGASGMREGLIALGYSLEEIASGSAEYMASLGAVSTRQRDDYSNLAKETDKYLTNLKIVSAFTGQDAKKAEVEAQRRATQAAVQAKIMRSANPEQELLKYKNALKLAGPGMEDSVDQLYSTGTVVGEAAVMLSQLPATASNLQQIVASIGDNSMSLDDQTKRLIDIQIGNVEARRQESLAASQTMGTVSILGMGYDKLALTLGQQAAYNTKIAKLSGSTAKEFEQNVLNIKEQGKNQNTATGKYAALVVKGQELQLDVQQMFNDVFENTLAFGNVVAEVTQYITEILAKAGYKVGGGGKSKGFGETEGGAATGNPNLGPKPNSRSNGTVGATLDEVIKTAGLPVTSTTGGKHEPGSKHPSGNAVDFSVKNMDATGVVTVLKALNGMNGVKAFAEDKNLDSEWATSIKTAGGEVKSFKTTSGPHIHAELMAKGGITNGLSIAGEAGPEAVVPLPDGRTIPVKIDMSDMTGKLDEMVRLLRDQLDNSGRMLHAIQ